MMTMCEIKDWLPAPLGLKIEHGWKRLTMHCAFIHACGEVFQTHNIAGSGVTHDRHGGGPWQDHRSHQIRRCAWMEEGSRLFSRLRQERA
jgi:hypothetical protein